MWQQELMHLMLLQTRQAEILDQSSRFSEGIGHPATAPGHARLVCILTSLSHDRGVWTQIKHLLNAHIFIGTVHDPGVAWEKRCVFHRVEHKHTKAQCIKPGFYSATTDIWGLFMRCFLAKFQSFLILSFTALYIFIYTLNVYWFYILLTCHGFPQVLLQLMVW